MSYILYFSFILICFFTLFTINYKKNRTIFLFIVIFLSFVNLVLYSTFNFKLYKSVDNINTEIFIASNPTSHGVHTIEYELSGIPARKFGDYEQVSRSYSHTRSCYSNLRVDNIATSFYTFVVPPVTNLPSQVDFRKLQRERYKCNNIISFQYSDIDDFITLQPNINKFEFSSNEAKIVIDNQNTKTIQLKFMDSYDTNWKAFVNNIEVTISKSKDGFKLIDLNKGINEVRFLHNRFPLYPFYFLAFISCFFVIAMIYCSILQPASLYAINRSDAFE